MSTPLSSVLIAPCLLADRPEPVATPVNAIVCIIDQGYIQQQNNGTAWVPYSPFDAAGGITELTGDVVSGPGSGSQAAVLMARASNPSSPVEGQFCMVVAAGVAEIRVFTSGVWQAVASLTLP